jgi:hypothetical protein
METIFINMIRLNDLLNEAKTLNSKPPYVTWKFGNWDKLNKTDSANLEQAMGKVLRTSVKLYLDKDIDGYVSLEFKDKAGNLIYAEWKPRDFDGNYIGGYGWKRWKHYANGDVDITETDLNGKGKEKNFFRYNFDKDWAYVKTIDQTGTYYSVIKQDHTAIQFSNNIMDKQGEPDSFVKLRPGTKAYNSVKTKVFND